MQNSSNLSLVPSNNEPTEVSGSLSIRNMDDLSRLAKMLNMSGYFKDATDAAQCGVKVLAGLEMGFGAFTSMTGIHVIKGKPAAGANLMAAAVKRHPKYNYRVREMSPKICKIEFFENGESCGISEFTEADARAAQTQNMDKFARNMLFARAMSNGVRWYCPDVFDAPVYTPEELGANVDGEGNVIEASVVEQPQIKPASSVNKNTERFKQIMAWTKHGPTQVREIALDLGLPASSADMSVDQALMLRDELFIDWGQAQEVFSHPKHAVSSFRKLDDGSMEWHDDQAVWEAWQAKIANKKFEQVKQAGIAELKRDMQHA